MTLLDAEVLELFERSVRGVLREANADADCSDALAELGWRDILAADAAAAVPVVFRTQGELRTRSTALDDVALDDVALDGESAGTTFVYAAASPGVAGTIRAGRLSVDGYAFHDPAGGRVALVALQGSDFRMVSMPVAACTTEPVGAIDPSLGLVRLTASTALNEIDVRAVEGLDRVLANCRRALAYELIGVVTTMLATATEYACVRHQYGHPIGTFQAVKHRLADVLIGLRAAEAVTTESWASEPDFLATAAKCLAGRAFRIAAENCLQVLGAIGFTEEHDLHRFIRRGKVLDVLLGATPALRVELGRALQQRRRVPRPGVL